MSKLNELMVEASEHVDLIRLKITKDSVPHFLCEVWLSQPEGLQLARQLLSQLSHMLEDEEIFTLKEILDGHDILS
jgi:hypothetical protein